MGVLAVLMFLVFSGSVLSDGEKSLVVPCGTADIECLSRSTETFLGQTHKGITPYGIVAIDPLVIPSLDVVFASEGLTYKNKNINITGLRNQKISDFKMDTTAKSVVLTTEADLIIDSDVTLELTKVARSYTGHYTSKATVLGTATYNYDLKEDDKGVKHFEVGPETITCSVVGDTNLQLEPEYAQTIYKDSYIKSLTEEQKVELRKKGFCKIAEKAYTSVIHNIRAAAKLLPASSFFNNI